MFAVNNANASDGICSELKIEPKPAIRLAQNGKIVRDIQLQDIEAREHVKHPAIISLFAPSSYSNITGSCSRACLTLNAKKSPCKGWQYYDGEISLDPAIFGTDKFEEAFSISFQPHDSSSSEEEEGSIEFTASGQFHGGWLSAKYDEQSLLDWLSGRKPSLTIFLVNDGDRDVHTQDLVGNLQTNPAAVNFLNNTCNKATLRPSENCRFTITAESATLKATQNIQYVFSIGNDAIGDGNGIIFIEREGNQKPRIFFRAGYSG